MLDLEYFASAAGRCRGAVNKSIKTDGDRGYLSHHLRRPRLRHSNSVTPRCWQQSSPTVGPRDLLVTPGWSTLHAAIQYTLITQFTRPARPSVHRNTQHRTFRLWQWSLVGSEMCIRDSSVIIYAECAKRLQLIICVSEQKTPGLIGWAGGIEKDSFRVSGRSRAAELRKDGKNRSRIKKRGMQRAFWRHVYSLLTDVLSLGYYSHVITDRPSSYSRSL